MLMKVAGFMTVRTLCSSGSKRMSRDRGCLSRISREARVSGAEGEISVVPGSYDQFEELR